MMYWQCETIRFTEEASVERSTDGFRAVFTVRHNKTGKLVRTLSANGFSSVDALQRLAREVGNAGFTAYVDLMK